MKDLKKEETIKPKRHHYFNMIIKLGSIGPKINLSTLPITSLVDLLRTSHFVSQKMLEMILHSLEFMDRGRRISLENFDGQLERNSRGIPYWNIYLQTTALITGRCLRREITKALSKKDNSSDPVPDSSIEDLILFDSIDIKPLSNFQKCDREALFSISESDFDFYPGYFCLDLLTLNKLLEDEQIQNAIKEQPVKYRLLLDD